MVGRDTAEEKRAVGHTSLTVAVSDEGVEEEHGDPGGDDEGGGEAIQPPLPPVSGSLRLRHRALLLRRRRPPQKGPPRPLHSFPAPPGLPSHPRQETAPSRTTRSQGLGESGGRQVGTVGNQKRGVRRDATRAGDRGCGDAAAWHRARGGGF